MQVPKINILLTTLNLTHEDIAEGTGLARSTVTMTIQGARRSKRAQNQITDFLRDRITSEALFGTEPEANDKTPPQKRL